MCPAKMGGLESSIRSAASLNKFKKMIKTFLFNELLQFSLLFIFINILMISFDLRPRPHSAG